MNNETEHVRFEILVNGERRCVVGIDGFGVCGPTVHWVLRDPKRKPKNRRITNRAWAKQELKLEVGGLRSASEQHVHWLHEDLKIGDEVTIKVLGPGTFDRPPDAPAPQ